LRIDRRAGGHRRKEQARQSEVHVGGTEIGRRLRGILADGDLKRILLAKGSADLDRPVSEFMTTHPRTIEEDALIAQAVRRMEENEGGAITSLVVVDGRGAPRGVIHLHDCLSAARG